MSIHYINDLLLLLGAPKGATTKELRVKERKVISIKATVVLCEAYGMTVDILL